MRWGVREEAEDDHMTTELCLKEIKACQTLSIGPKFVVRCEFLWGLTVCLHHQTLGQTQRQIPIKMACVKLCGGV